MVEGSRGIYNSAEAAELTIVRFAKRLESDVAYRELAIQLQSELSDKGVAATFGILAEIATLAKELNNGRLRRVALALSYSEEEEEDFASKEDLEWIPRVKEGLSSYGLESVEYQITEDATSFQEAWFFPGERVRHPELGALLIGVDYFLEPRTAKPIPRGHIALSVFFETIVPDSKGTASKHILPLYLVVVKNNRLSVKLAILRLRLRVGLFGDASQKLEARFEEIKSKKA
jgi:hypothetical protein